MSRTNPRNVLIIVCAVILLLAAGCQEDTVSPPRNIDDTVTASPADKASPGYVAIFGFIESNGTSDLIVRVAPPVDLDENPEVLWAETLPGKRISGQPLPVMLDPQTSVEHPDGDWADLQVGSPVMIGGELTRAGLIAHFIIDPRELAIDPADMPDVSATGKWVKGPPLDLPIPAALLPGDLDPASAPDTGSDPCSEPCTREFPGSFGGPSWTFDSGELFIPVLTTLISIYYVDRIVPTVGLGGGHYNFPFNFAAEGTAPLIVGQEGDLQIQVTPESPPDNDYSYYWALGFNVETHWRRCSLIPWGCSDYTYHFSILSSVSATRDPAPLHSDGNLDIPHNACPGIPIFGIEDFSVAEIEVCQDQTLEGDYFYADVLSRWSHPFDTPAETFRVTPHTNPMRVEMSNLNYAPNFTAGFSLQLSVLTIPVYDTPKIVDFAEGHMNFVPPVDTNCDSFFEVYTCGEDQETSVTLLVPTIPSVTWVTAEPFITRYGDVLRLEAKVEGANGPGDSPKEVGFYDGDVLLATVPIDAEDMAYFETSTLEPCRHVITARYVGVDDEGNTYPSEKSTVAIVTGDDETSRMEGYWQHQCLGMGDCDFDPATMDCYLAIVGELSRVFSEIRDISTGPAAHDVLFMGGNHGSALEQLDRELLVAWLNFANGSFRYDEVLDTDKDGIPDTTFQAVMEAAESVRLNPGASKRELKEQMQILHHIKDMTTMSTDDLMDGR